MRVPISSPGLLADMVFLSLVMRGMVRMRSSLVRRQRADGERVDFASHPRPERIIDKTVTRSRALADERSRNDGQAVVTAAALGAFVADVQGALVDQLQLLGRERLETFANLLLPFAHELLSSTWRASMNACASTNASISPMPPNSLKLTQASVEKV